MADKIPASVSEVMRLMGRKGQKARQKKYSTKDFSKWGKKGGRPPNPEIARIMKEHDCSRQRAYQILNGKSNKKKVKVRT